MGVLQSLKAKVIVGMVAILTVLAGFYGWGIAQQGRADATPPTTSKTLTDNGDGTYTLSLSVTGTASSVTTSNKADVIVVIDTSNSMNNHIEHETGRFGYRNGNYINLYSRSGNSYSQLTDDTYSGTVYYRAGTSYFTYTGTRYSVTRLAVAKDSVNSLAQQLLANNTAENPDRVQLSLVTFGTNASTRITGTTNLSNFQSTVNGLTTNGGTNWEDALQKANAVATRPGAEAYVIFVSDGNPTFWLNPNGTVGGTGGEGASNVATAYSHAVDDAQAIVGAGKHFYGIGVFGSVDRMQSLVTDAGAPANNYYSATDQAALNAAFTTIINEITNAFGYTNVGINDGLTGMTAAALVAGQPDGFTYTRSGGSYGGGTAWDGAPQATYNGSAVSWDLGSMTLENGVTYTVSFKVWPKQEAYDLVADLNNGFTSYDDLTEAQKEQIVALTGGGYGLKTNTEANISYTQIETITTSVLPDGATQNPDGSYSHDGFTYTQNADGTWTGTKETEGTGTFDSPDPMPLTNSKMMVTKTWNDSIDPDQRPDEVTLRILRDDDSYAEVVLNAANNWTQQIDVAPGLIVDGETLETGHDYTIEEVDPDYHFELDADPFHPMIVDGVLNKNETGGATVTATNDLKGRLNISKTVTHSSDTTPNPNQLFTYTIKIDESNDDDVWFSIGNSSGPIDVSGENRVTGATVDEDLKYYHAASGTEITVKIKGGENIYFLNLAAGSTYEVEEVNVPSAYTCTVTNSDSGATTSGNKTSGSIVSNTLHTVAYTNAYAVSPTTATIPVTKVLSIPTGQTGPGDITGEFTFTLTAADGTPMPDDTELTNPDADGGTVSFGDITYTKPGTYTYTVAEAGKVDGVNNDPQASKTITVVVTDNGDGTLSATVHGANPTPTDPANTTFTNSYATTEVSAQIPVTKTLVVPSGLTGPGDITGKYTFTLAAQGGAPMPAAGGETVTNPAATGGTASFGSITYDAPGEYTYIITEDGEVDGVTNDTAAETGKTVTVEVVDNGDGTLTATVKGADGTEEEPSEGTTFTNTYAASGSVTLEATKVAVGFELEADQFSFELKDAEGNVLQTKTNDAAGKIAFDAISYSEAGTYNYTINEVVIDGNGIAEDTHVANVEVTVIDNGDGTLTATPEYEDATFTNTHTDTEKDVVSAGDTTTSVDGELVQAGDTLTYTITYANNTSGVATVTVTDAIPANTTYVDGSASDGGVEDNGTITWTIENVAAGATGTVTFQVTVDEGANGETIENAATVFDGENQSSSNAVTTSIPVKDVLDADDASVDGGSAQVGDTLTYEVTFTLTKDCTSVVVTDDVPANTTLVDGSVSDGGVEAGGTITWDLGALDAGTYTVSFQVTVDESAVTADAITNTASISVNNHSEVETNTTTTTTEKGGLTISKEILVPAGFEIDKDKVFTFTVSLVDKNGAALTGEYNYTGSSVGTIRNGGSIELKHGESITIAGLPAGTKYKIVETAVAGYTAVQDTFEAVIPNGGEPAAAAFKNKYGDDLETTVSFPVEKVLSVPDGLTGPDIREKYTFKLNAKVGTPMPDKTELKNPDATGGRVTFGPITYDTPGVYEYTVTEDGAVTGVVNDVTASKTVTVTVTDNGDGTLTATASSTEDGPLTFTNSYSVNSTTATITAKKLLEHADLAAGAFNFVLSAADGTPMPASPNATNAADGTVAFGEITYSVPGTFTYTIKETAGSATYFDYDGSEKTVTVEVVDNGDGTLTATVTGDGDDATFTNTYKAGSDEVFINAVKNVNGEAASLNMFEFTIAADDGGALPDETTVTNNGGSVTFGPIKYDVSIFDDPAPAPDPDEPETVSLTFIPVGIEGTIMRAVPYLNGVPRDELLVEIRKDDEGAWEPHTWEGLPSRDDEGNDIAFEVYYTVDEGTTPERASGLMLQLTGGAAAEPAEPTAPRVKVFHYTITETDGGAPGYTYDGHSEMVIVRVTDNGDGTLDTEVEYDEDGAVFNNAYEASGEAEIEATKVLNGTDLAAGQFEFGLFEGDTQVGGAVTNGADGSIVFTVPYSNVDLGTHVYTVRELVGTPQTGYTYDSSSKTVTVEVTDNGDGTLSTEVEYGGDMTFTNAYKPLPTEVTLEAEKVLEGRDLVTGEFDFMLEDEDGNVVSSGTNDASGKIAFSAIPITKAGTYIFTAYEVKGDAAGVTYDDTRFVYEVDVEDDGGQLTITEVRTNDRVLFTNTYAEPPVPTPDPEPKPTPQKPAVRKGKAALPKTGDPTSPFYSAILAGISVVAMLAGALLKVRPQEKRAVGHSATPKRGGRA